MEHEFCPIVKGAGEIKAEDSPRRFAPSESHVVAKEEARHQRTTAACAMTGGGAPRVGAEVRSSRADVTDLLVLRNSQQPPRAEMLQVTLKVGPVSRERNPDRGANVSVLRAARRLCRASSRGAFVAVTSALGRLLLGSDVAGHPECGTRAQSWSDALGSIDT